MSTITTKWSNLLLFGTGLLTINTLLWLHLLLEIKRTRLPVNCAGAWPADLPILVFIAVLLLLSLAYGVSKCCLKKLHSITISMVLIDSMILMIFIFNSGVVAYCECSNPWIIERSYIVTAAIYTFDTLAKSHMLFSTVKHKKE